MKDLRWLTVSGAAQEASIAMRCGLACKVLEFQIHPRMVVDVGLTMVLDADKRNPHR